MKVIGSSAGFSSEEEEELYITLKSMVTVEVTTNNLQIRKPVLLTPCVQCTPIRAVCECVCELIKNKLFYE